MLWQPEAEDLLVALGGAPAPDIHCVLSSHPLAGSEVLVGEDPSFAGPGDYRLSIASPAIDFCDGSRAGGAYGDLDGELRGTDQPGVPDRFAGAHFDLGFDEFLGAPTSIFADGFESGTTGAWSP